MQNPQRSLIQCVNCNICVNTLRRHLVMEQNVRIVSLFCQRRFPVIITEEDFVCDACLQRALQALQADVLVLPTDALVGHSHVCVACGRSLINLQSNVLLVENPTELQNAIAQVIGNRITPLQVDASHRICHYCWLSARREAINAQLQVQPVEELLPEAMAPQDHEEAPLEVEPVVDPEELEEHIPAPLEVEPLAGQLQVVEDLPQALSLINYRRAANTATHCVFHGCLNRDLHRVSDPLRVTILVDHNYYVPIHGRICGEHLVANNFEMLFDSQNSYRSFNIQQVEHIFSLNSGHRKFIDFSSLENIRTIDEDLFKYWLGMSKENFFSLVNEVPRILEIHRGLLGLGILLMKMRTGDSDARLAELLHVPRRTLERLMGNAREVLIQDFVPSNLGIRTLSHEDLLQYNLCIPNALFNENNANAIAICDGTYIYVNKSSNYMFQKETYSLHKYRNLVKPFMLVACDGYIIDCFGPYKATTSDAVIMNDLFRDVLSPLRSYFQENDIFILDRGFRDSIGLLENCGYKPYMPETVLEGEHQLTTQQANRSRKVTLCRWVVEAVNGQFKRDFKIFRQDYFNKTVPYMMQNFQIAASLLNRFGVRFQDREDANEIVSVVNERFHFQNHLSQLVEDMNMNRRMANFVSITADRNNEFPFPRFELSDLILFALGTYQIRQARSYFGEHVRFHGEYRIEICSMENINTEGYDMRGTERDVPGREGLPEYCCSCLVGRRSMGCCAHIMCVVWYLGWARHQDNIIYPPAQFLDSVIVRDIVEE